MNRISFKRPLLYLLGAVFLLFGCKKENIKASALQGKWTGISRIKKTTTIDPITQEPRTGSDTLICSDITGKFLLDFNRTHVTAYYQVFGNIVDLKDEPFTLSGNRLTFNSNPFTRLEMDPSAATAPLTSTVQVLGKRKMILYDVDTVQRQPLLVFEVWFNFER